MMIQQNSPMITASLLMAQSDAARAEVTRQQDDGPSTTSTVEALRREKAVAQKDYMADRDERYEAREIITNDHVDDSVNLVAERYRQKALELMKALVKLSGQDDSAAPIDPQNTEEPDIGTTMADFVRANIDTISRADARLTLETEYVEYATGDGNDAVAVTDDTVSGMRTGDGSDAVSISADRVYSVHTDADRATMAHIVGDGFGGGHGGQRRYSNADSLSIQARDVQDIWTGGGADSIAVQSRLVNGVHAGAGNDAVAINGGLVEYVNGDEGHDSIAVKAVLATRIDGGAGDDVISVDVEQGNRPLDTIYTPRAEGSGRELRFSSLSNADVQGGAGNDTLNIRADRHISVDGGLGDDRMHLESGTVALKYRSGDGQDHVSLGKGVSVLVDLDSSARYTVDKTDGLLTLSFEDGGAITFEGVDDAANLIVRNGDGTRFFQQDGTFDAPGQQTAPMRSIDLRA